MTSSWWLTLPVLALVAMSFNLGFIIANGQTRAAQANTERAIENTKRLLKMLNETTASLQQTTASLEYQNEVVKKLQAEKCAAWSVPP